MGAIVRLGELETPWGPLPPSAPPAPLARTSTIDAGTILGAGVAGLVLGALVVLLVQHVRR